jgi:hypothetical protein
MLHACNPKYLGGTGKTMEESRTTLAKLVRFYLKSKAINQKKDEGVFEVEWYLSTEFNTQYHTQKKDIFSKQRFLL